MFISFPGFFSSPTIWSFMKCPSPSTHKCQFNGQVRLNKKQLNKNTVVWRTVGCIFGAVGAWGWGVML